MSNQVNYITVKGIESLKAEYQELQKVERPKLVEVVAWAAGNGDRSENGDYIYGKKRLREIDRRLHYLLKRIEDAVVIDPQIIESSTIVFGATVTLEMESGDFKTYQIVGEDEFDISLGKISWRSPLGRVLIGKKEGNEVLLEKPSGKEFLIVTKVEFQ